MLRGGVLEGTHTELRVGHSRLGIAGTIGFGGGFGGAYAADFGELEMKAFAARTRRLAESFRRALSARETPIRIALLHYAPIPDTVAGEPLEIYPFLGSDRLGEAIDSAGADLTVHGDAHHGVPGGMTRGGVPVRNVAQPMIGAAYRVLEFVAREVAASTTIA